MTPIRRHFVAASAALVLWFLAPFPTVRAETPEEAFDRGNAAYEAGRYAEAVEAYQTLRMYRVRDPRVDYNLGNAEFKLGRLGPAILSFERARRMAPTDREILDNLEYARSFCRDQVQVEAPPALVRWVRSSQDRLGPDRQAWTVVGLVWLLSGLLAWSLRGPGRFRAIHGWTVAALALTAALIAASWWITWDRLEGTRSAVVFADVAEVLAGPGENNPTLFTVHEGLTVEVRDVRSEWIQVSLPNGLNGWIPRDAVGLV